MKSLFNPVNNDQFCSNNPGAAEMGWVVSLAALRAVRANATISTEGGQYAPVVAPAG